MASGNGGDVNTIAGVGAGSLSNGDGPGSIVRTYGETSLWVGFAFFAVSAVVLMFLSYIRNVRPEARLSYYLCCIINAITALAYLTMALGQTAMRSHNNIRDFLWIRYAAWAFVSPDTVLHPTPPPPPCAALTST